MKKENNYPIGQVAEKLDVSDATLRQYENDYKLKVPRNELRHRFYTTKEAEVVKQIIELNGQEA